METIQFRYQILRNLGFAVLLQALKDCRHRLPELPERENFSRREHFYSSYNGRRAILSRRNQADFFLFEDTVDFPFWCNVAGLDWRTLRTRLFQPGGRQSALKTFHEIIKR